MKVKEFIELVNNYENPFLALYDVEDAVDEKTKKVATIDIEVDKDAVYATDIYQCEDGFVGVSGLHEILNECLIPSDLDVNCEASEYEEVQVISYKPKECHS